MLLRFLAVFLVVQAVIHFQDISKVKGMNDQALISPFDEFRTFSACDYPSLPILDRFRNPYQCNASQPCSTGECVYLWLGISICCTAVKDSNLLTPRPLLSTVLSLTKLISG